jgi:hypothetical protein
MLWIERRNKTQLRSKLVIENRSIAIKREGDERNESQEIQLASK